MNIQNLSSNVQPLIRSNQGQSACSDKINSQNENNLHLVDNKTSGVSIIF